MICPKCKCEIPDDSKFCSFCDKKIKGKKVFFRKTKKVVASDKKTEANENLTFSKKIKFFGALLLTLLIVFLIIYMVLKLNEVSGTKSAKELSEYINEPILTARNEIDIHLLEESNFDGVNCSVKFDYMVESEKDIKIDGVKYPQWAVFIVLNDNDEIAKVQYTNYKILKKHHKGIKVDEEINLNKFSKGNKFKKISNEIDIEPFSIVYENGYVKHIYKYYFVNSHKDEQAMILSVISNEKNEFQSSVTERVYEVWST
ncbi:MAG: zinc ribbon domain-containing protein [Clostridiales bacterium]|nr:zinc ribbon domain-containing protein [Clostridiales bacterium]